MADAVLFRILDVAKNMEDLSFVQIAAQSSCQY